MGEWIKKLWLQWNTTHILEKINLEIWWYMVGTKAIMMNEAVRKEKGVVKE